MHFLNKYAIIIKDLSLLYGRGAICHEESPSSTGQGCLITSGKGDFKDSATEINRHSNMVRMERRGKSSPILW